MTSNRAVLLAIPFVVLGCKSKPAADKGPTADPAGSPTEPATPPTAKPADEPPNMVLALPPDTELDLAPWGEAFAGYVLTAPKGSEVEFDDPSRQLKITDTDFLSVGEAPGFADAMNMLKDDKDNSKINKVSDTEVRWERNPPLGQEWNFDVMTAVKGWDCSGSTFTSAAMADKLVAICKSIRKK